MVSEWLLQQEHIIREEELAWGSQLWSIFFKNMSLMLGLGGFFKKINVKGAPCASCNHYKLGNHLVHVVFWLAGSCCKGCLWIPWQRTHCRYLWPIRRSISAVKKLWAFRMIKIALWFTALEAFLMLRLRSTAWQTGLELMLPAQKQMPVDLRHLCSKRDESPPAHHWSTWSTKNLQQ